MIRCAVHFYRPPRRLFFGQCLKAGDDVEEFLVDAALAQLVEVLIEVLQQLVDVFFGPLHGGQSAGVFAGQGFGACPEERDEEILMNERPQGCRTTADDLRQISRRPREYGQLASPGFVQRQQALIDRRIHRSGRRAVIKEVEFRDFPRL